ERTRETLQVVLDNMTDGVLMFDKDFRWLFINRQLIDYQHYPPELAYRGASGYDLLRFQVERGDFGPVDDVEKAVRERAERMLHPRRPLYERRLPNGIYVEFNFRPLADGSTLAVYRDITQLRNREEALATAKEAAEVARADAERSREMLQTVIDNMRDGVML